MSVIETVFGSIGHALTFVGRKIEKASYPYVEDIEIPASPIRFWTKVVGVTFEGRQDRIKSIYPSMKCVLRIDKAAQHRFPKAVAVIAGGEMIGHLTGKRENGYTSITEMIYDKLKAGKYVKVLRMSKFGGTETYPRRGVGLLIESAR